MITDIMKNLNRNGDILILTVKGGNDMSENKCVSIEDLERNQEALDLFCKCLKKKVQGDIISPLIQIYERK